MPSCDEGTDISFNQDLNVDVEGIGACISAELFIGISNHIIDAGDTPISTNPFLIGDSDLDHIAPISPGSYIYNERPLEKYIWPASQKALALTQTPDADHCYLIFAPDTLHPPPIDHPPPPGCHYPMAPTYFLRRHPGFQAGWCYVAHFNTSETVEEQRAKLLIVTPPPGWQPVKEGGNYILNPVEGSTRAIASIPFGITFGEITDDNFDQDQWVTLAVVFTLNSLQLYPSYPAILATAQKLHECAFAERIYARQLKPNDRSSSSTTSKAFNGSFNTASRKLEGYGKQGIVGPATQLDGEEDVRQLGRLNELAAELWRLVMPLGLTRAEWEAMFFWLDWKNAPRAGGTEPAFVALQLNVSSSRAGESLAEFIGRLQGKFHVDQGDDKAFWTLLVMLLRLPKGKKVMSAIIEPY